MPTITAGGTPQTITLPEGQVLNVSGTAGTAGVVYRLDPVQGGTNSLQSWAIGAGALAPIGPYAGEQRFLVTCSVGSVDAAVGGAIPLLASVPVLKLSRILTRGPLNNTPVHGSGAPNNNNGATGANTASIKMELEGDFDQVRLIIGGFEINGSPIAGIKALLAATETASTDTTDNAFRPIAGGLKYNVLRSQTDNYGWDAVTWRSTSAWDGVSALPIVTDLASAATGTLPLAQVDNLPNQRPVDGPSGMTLPSFLISDWMPTSSIPRADGGMRPLLLVRIYMPGDATHKWSWMSIPAGGSYQADAAQRAAFRYRVYQAAYSFSDNVGTLTDSFSLAVASIIPWFFVQYKSRNGGITTMNIGDSITECTYMNDTVSAWGHRAACDASSPELPIQVINGGWSGKSTMQYWKQARNLMTVMRPDVITYSPYSQNDVIYTRRASQSQLIRTSDMLDYCAQNGITPICWTGTPIETFGAAPEAERRYVNAQAMRLLPGTLALTQMLDLSALVSRGLAAPATDLFKPDLNGNSYKFNAGHPSEWAMETSFVPTLATALRRLVGKVT
ncbi:SGNH/GDSL hydrolase family protein [Janthinobacterium lividum]|uniref:SGNH/GDSL hydrolase family protein n=1 Tax=Janthinobacterium lividum TaxID=29581 RepID=UPI00140DD1F4|nr:SGNH/GDSL hydrolase family protein [Janthinobacterium lividum]NHQ93310.1 SGNH/GDSL hydrolase family protein [Janthinobacterium lividum]